MEQKKVFPWGEVAKKKVGPFVAFISAKGQRLRNGKWHFMNYREIITIIIKRKIVG